MLTDLLTMRRSDIFTLAEIFFDREYAVWSQLPANPVVLDCGANVGFSSSTPESATA